MVNDQIRSVCGSGVIMRECIYDIVSSCISFSDEETKQTFTDLKQNFSTKYVHRKESIVDGLICKFKGHCQEEDNGLFSGAAICIKIGAIKEICLTNLYFALSKFTKEEQGWMLIKDRDMIKISYIQNPVLDTRTNLTENPEGERVEFGKVLGNWKITKPIPLVFFAMDCYSYKLIVEDSVIRLTRFMIQGDDDVIDQYISNGYSDIGIPLYILACCLLFVGKYFALTWGFVWCFGRFVTRLVKVTHKVTTVLTTIGFLIGIISFLVCTKMEGSGFIQTLKRVWEMDQVIFNTRSWVLTKIASINASSSISVH